MNRPNYRLLFLLILAPTCLWGQQPNLYPANWWTGMKHNYVQILVKSPDPQFNTSEVSVNYAGVALNKVHRLDNGKYPVSYTHLTLPTILLV